MKTIRFVIASLILVAGGWWAFAPAEEQASVPAPVVVPIQAAAVVQREPLRGCTMRPGQTLASLVSVRSRSKLPGASTGIEVGLELSGRIDLEVLSDAPQGAVLAGRFSEMNVSADVAVGSMESPFLVEIDQHCRLTRFARWKEAAPHLARNQQAILWDTQWTSDEGVFHGADGVGPFTAVMRRRGDQLERELDSYSSIWQQRITPTKVLGRMVVTMGDGPWFESLDGRRTVEAEGVSIDSQLSMHAVHAAEGRFSAREREESSYVWGDLLPAAGAMHASRPVNRYDHERRAAVGPQSLEVAMVNLETRAKDASVGLQDTWPQLSSWFEVHPERIADAVQSLKSGELVKSDRGGTAFYMALGNARVPEARDALLAIKRDQRAPGLEKARAMFALIDRDDVGVAFAHELATDASALISSGTRSQAWIANKALLALTAMSGLRNDVEVHDVAVATVSPLLDSAVAERRKLALKALGNIGDVTLMPLAQRSMEDVDVSIREAATSVFRRLPPVQTDTVALSWLQREQHPFVKAKLYDVLRSQHHDAQFPAPRALAMQALSDLRTARSLHARRQMIRLLATSEVAQEADVRRAMVAQAKQERAAGSELLNEFTDVLTPEEAWEVLR